MMSLHCLGTRRCDKLLVSGSSNDLEHSTLRDMRAVFFAVTFYRLAPLRPIYAMADFFEKPRHSSGVKLSQLPLIKQIHVQLFHLGCLMKCVLIF